MKSLIYNFAKYLIGWPLSLVALYFIWQIIAPNSQDLISNLSNINYTLFTIGLISFLVFYTLRSYIWHRLLREKNHKIPFKQTSYLWAISEIKRYIPGKFWFILGRAVAFYDKGVAKKDTGKFLITELQIFAVSSLVVSLLSIPFLQDKPQFAFLNSNDLYSSLIILLVFLLAMLFIYSPKLLQLLPQKLQKILNPLIPEFSPSSILFLLFISSIALVFFGLGNYFLIISLKFITPQLIPDIVGFFTLSFFLGFLSFLTPAGLGIREGIITLGLSSLMTYDLAALISLFSRIMLVITEIIFIFITFIISKIKNKKFLQFENYISKHPQASIIALLYSFYSIYFTIVSFLRYDHFYTGRFDLGNMAQTVWNTTQGRIFIFTNPDGTDIVSRMAFHSDVFLVLLAPFYMIWSNPKVLLLIQTIIVGAGAFFVYALARDILKNKNIALALSFMYLINPSIERANIYDFHAVTLVTFFLLGAFYFYYQKRFITFSVFALLAASTKEEIWLITAIFGILIFFISKKRVLGSTIFAISVLAFYYIVWHAIPAARGSGHFALGFFSQFGNSPGEIIENTILSPLQVINTTLEPSRLSYLQKLFFPVGFLSILSPLYIILAAPDLLINLLSSNDNFQQIYYQYTAPISPFIFITVIFGLKTLLKFIKIPSNLIIIYLIFFSLFGAYLYGPLPGSQEPNIVMFTKQNPFKEYIDNYLDSIPKDLSVMATNNIGSHLSHRERIYTYPKGIDEADVIIFLLKNPDREKEEVESIQVLSRNNNYYIDYRIDKFIVFRKKAM